MKELTVLRIDTPLAQRLKVAAAQERTSMKALAQEFISRGLVQSERDELSRVQDRIESGALRIS